MHQIFPYADLVLRPDCVVFWAVTLTTPLNLREEHRLRALKNSVLRRIFGPKMKEDPVSYPMGARGSFSGGKVAGA
jgi:hypothetical protein